MSTDVSPIPAAAVTVVVAVKSVPIGGQQLRVTDGELTRAGISHGLDPVNQAALEWAVQARDEGAVGRVVAVSMGPPAAVDALRTALAMGCDEVLLVSDDDLDGADVRATATVLAHAIRRFDADLAVFGYESADGSSGAVPAATAALLDWPVVSRVTTTKMVGTTVRSQRSSTLGTEDVEVVLPVVLSMVEGSIVPRYPTLRDILAARRRSVSAVGLADLGLRPPVPLRRERVVRVAPATVRRREPQVVGAAEGIALILDAVQAGGTGR